MKKNLTRLVVPALASIVPLSASAASHPGTFRQFAENLTGIIGSTIPLLIGLATLALLWGLSKFILHAGSEEKRREGKQVMIWGIIALFVILSLWGIVLLISQTFFGFGTPGYDILP